MEEVINLHHEKLGDIFYRKGPQDIHCWSGMIEECAEGFSIILSHADLATVDIEFIVQVIQNWTTYIEKAFHFIRLTLHSAPELLGLDKKTAAKYLEANDLPLDLPQFLFYENGAWLLHFFECSFPIGTLFGMGINFHGEEPISIEDFSEAEEISDKKEPRCKKIASFM